MALQLTYTAPEGFTAPQAYHHIDTFAGGQDAMTISVVTHYDAAARIASPYLQQKQYPFVPDANIATSLWVQGYTFLKAQGDFTGSVDV